MYCERCNVDFTEGLRYCKWCGQALIDHPRVTGELRVCANCASAVQTGWLFCKLCGVRLAAPVSDPEKVFCPKCGAEADATAATCDRCGTNLAPEPARSGREPHSTSIMGSCPACGERLETGSVYCKACGAAVYAEARPFGGSALLCGVCKSYSPVGSPSCRVCGALLGHEAEGETITFAQEKPSTLRDLAEHFSETKDRQQPDDDQGNSGASTAIFSTPGDGADASGTSPIGDPRTQSVGSPRVEGPGTNPFPGVTGSKPDTPARTMRVPKTKITTPVEEDVLTEGLSSTDDPASLESETVIMTSPFAQPPAETQNVSPTLPATNARAYASQEQGSTTWFSEGQPPAEASAMAGSGVAQPSAEPQPQQKKLSGVAIASIIVGIIIVAGAVYVVWSFVAKGRPAAPQPAPITETKPPEPPPTPPPSAPAVPAGMVMVKAGAYTVGGEDGDVLAAPPHSVTLPAFYIDRTEVTNAEYAKFVEATKHKPPSNWKGAGFPAGRDNYPVTGVTWQDATDYAAWAGKRLPTEAEWEAAARGSDARKYPWGNDWQPGSANIGVRTSEKAEASKYPSGIAEVGKYPQGASPLGALDMIGNAWEWVVDEITLYPGSSATLPAPTDDPAATLRVIRGGAYDGDQKHDASYRGYLDGNLPYPKVGFRCVKSAGQ